MNKKIPPEVITTLGGFESKAFKLGIRGLYGLDDSLHCFLGWLGEKPIEDVTLWDVDAFIKDCRAVGVAEVDLKRVQRHLILFYDYISEYLDFHITNPAVPRRISPWKKPPEVDPLLLQLPEYR